VQRGPILPVRNRQTSPLRQSAEVVRRELAADSEGASDRRRGGFPERVDRQQDAEPEVAIPPVLLVQPDELGCNRAPPRIVSHASLCPFLVHEPPADEDPEMVARDADAQSQGPRDRPEVVPRQSEEVLIDPSPSRMIEEVDGSVCHPSAPRVPPSVSLLMYKIVPR